MPDMESEFRRRAHVGSRQTQENWAEADLAQQHPLLDVLTSDPHCPVCNSKGVPTSDDRGIAYFHPGRNFLCRVTARVLESS